MGMKTSRWPRPVKVRFDMYVSANDGGFLDLMTSSTMTVVCMRSLQRLTHPKQIYRKRTSWAHPHVRNVLAVALRNATRTLDLGPPHTQHIAK